MSRLLFLALVSFAVTAAAQYDVGGQNTQGANVDSGKRKTESAKDGGASAGASGNAARTRAGGSASVEGGAALGATGVNTRPAAKAEDEERQERRRARRK